MRVSDDTRKAVVFLGEAIFDDAGQEKFVGRGTGFFFHHDGWSHLVTCAHVAAQLDGIPFVIRGNKKTGGPQLVDVARIHWFRHPDPNVDVAVLPCGMPEDSDWLVLAPDMALTGEELNGGPTGGSGVGIGDLAYVVGLFRLLHGKKRNLPVVHSGNIALMASDEKIPVFDPATKVVRQTEAHLVEINSLDGLSGAPVFVRKTWRTNAFGVSTYMTGDLKILGMWMSAWDGEPNEHVADRFGGADKVKVPLGLGAVVPIAKILETLARPDVKAYRDKVRALAEAKSAPIAQSAAGDSVR